MESTSSAVSTVELMEYIKIVSGIISALGVGGLVGYLLRYSLDQKSEIKRKLRESKEIQYQDLLSNALAFFKGWEDKECKKQFLREVYTKAPLYASDEVVKLAYKFIASHSDLEKNKESDKCYTELVLAIRKELKRIQKEPETTLRIKDINIMKVDD